jgi:hypothetical protein
MFVENLNVFFQSDEFAVDATLNGMAVRGVFDNEFDASSIAVGDIAGSSPGFTLRTVDVPAKPVGKLLVLGAKTYKVVEHRPDGTGVSVLRLEA